MNRNIYLFWINLEANKYVQALAEYEKFINKYEQTIRKLKSLNENEQQMAHRLDLYSVSTSRNQSS